MKIRRPNAEKTETVKAVGITGEQIEESLFGDQAVDGYELTPEIFVLEVKKYSQPKRSKSFR